LRIGIDSYSYHRRYGEIRPGESVPLVPPWPRDPDPVLAHARSLDVDDLMLETCYLPPPEAITLEMLGGGEAPAIGFSWGHPWPDGAFHGLESGRNAAAEADLARWISTAGRLGHHLMRITLGSPATRSVEPSRTKIGRLIDPVRRGADRAAEVGLSLAIENHGDLTAGELHELVGRVERPNIGVTLDNVNLIRLGDDMIEGTRRLARYTRIVQLKDHQPTDEPDAPGGPISTALGEGCAPLDAVLAELWAVGFDGPVCVELASLGAGPVDELAMLERSVVWLRSRA
jgi:sugar phosphate isomerase/epimerase